MGKTTRTATREDSLQKAAQSLESACHEVAHRVRLLEAKRLAGTLDDESRARGLAELRAMSQELLERRASYAKLLQHTCCDTDEAHSLLEELVLVEV